MLSDIEIAQSATLKPIVDIAAQVGLTSDDIEQYGKYKAKVSHEKDLRDIRQENAAALAEDAAT